MKSKMLLVRKLFFTVLIAVLLAGLGTLPAFAQDPAYTLTITSGDAQSAPAGTHFAAPLKVTVTDAAGAAAPGVSVTFAAPSSGASAYLTAPGSAYGTSLAVTTDASGVASVSPTASCAPGAYQLTATVGEQSVTFSLTNSGTESPYCRDSSWMADPLNPGQPAPGATDPIDSSLPGYWWRDTSNQNALLQHSEDIGRSEAVTLYNSPTFNVYYSAGGGANVTLITTAHYYAIIGCGGGTIEATNARDNLFRYTVGKTLEYVILPDSKDEYIWGCKIWTKSQSGVHYYGHQDFDKVMLQQFYIEERLRSSKESFYGTFLPWGADSFVGAGRFKEYRAVRPEFYQQPTITISAKTDITLEGNTITLAPAIGEQKDNLVIWLPDAGVLIPGDSLSWQLPDIGVIPEGSADLVVNDLYHSLDSLRDYNASILVPKVGPAVVGASNVLQVILEKRDAIQYIRDQTLNGIKAGYSLEQLQKTIKLPDYLASSPYNQEFASDIPGIVRIVWNNFMGGWDGTVMSLASTIGDTDKAQFLADAYGGTDQLIAAAKQAELGASSLESAEKALYLADAAYRVAPDNFVAKQIYAQTLRKNAFLQKSAYKRNYYLSIANGLGVEQLVSDITKSGPEDAPLAFTSQEFSQGFNGIGGATLTTARIDSLPDAAAGVLTLPGADADGNPITVPVTAGQEIALADLNGLVFTPVANWNGSASFEWNGKDGSGYAANDAFVHVTITPVNDAPVISTTPLADVTINEDAAPSTIDLSTGFTDVDGDVLIYTASSDTAGVTPTVSGSTLTLAYQANWNGSVTINVAGADMDGASISDSFTVTVSPANDPPTAQDVTITLVAGKSQTIPLEYSDLETAQANLQVTFGALDGTLDASALPNLKYTAPSTSPDQTIDDSFTYTVTDRGDPDGCSAAPCSAPASTTATIHVTVLPAPSGSISGTVFNDANANGSLDTGESGLAGVTVQLQDASGAQLETFTTAANGAYTFTGLDSGSYQVFAPKDANRVQTTQNPIAVTLVTAQAVTGADIGSVVSADLSVSMSYSVSGKAIIYAITVTNDGPATATGVSLSDALPENLSYITVLSTQGSCSGGKTVTCNIGTLAKGANVTITLKVNRTSTKTAVVNSAALTSSVFDINGANNTASTTIP